MNKFRVIILAEVLTAFLILGCTGSKDHSVFTNSLGMKMIQIPAETFQMGDESGDWDEVPVHRVTISKPFYVSETEVTIEQFQAFLKSYRGEKNYAPFAAGVSWYEANRFCRWLSKKEGKTYRLPTEAEWEYVCRAGTTTPFASGEKLPANNRANNWGVKNMHSGVLEWCADWYGLYPESDQVDPVGYDRGIARVVRGGLPDRKDESFDHPVSFYYRSANRSGIAPSYRRIKSVPEVTEKLPPADTIANKPGLVGVIFSKSGLKNPTVLLKAPFINSDSIHWETANDWSFRLKGFLNAPVSGKVRFTARMDNGMRLIVGGKTVIDAWDKPANNSGEVKLVKGKNIPLTVDYFQDGGESFLKLYWEWASHPREVVPKKYFWYSQQEERWAEGELAKQKKSSGFCIGFRVVQADLPKTESLRQEKSFVMQGVRQNKELPRRGPAPDKPYFRKRYMLPTPLENSKRQAIDAAGFPPFFWGHNHSPGLEVLPNGDVLLVIFTSNYHEYEPGVSLIAARRRFGEDQWEFPSSFINFPDVNDAGPLLWNEGDSTWLFMGNPSLEGKYPFAWTISRDNFSSFREIRFPNIIGPMGGFTPQPINSALRDKDGTLCVSCDGTGGHSLLWETRDNGRTWFDPQGRTGGRHTTFVLLKDGRILGMGGKKTAINGFMPKSISSDGGRSWEVSVTRFPSLGTNQRPTIIRLKSGRLFFAGDYQRFDGFQPKGINRHGAYVALSDDEGKTWYQKPLPGVQPHERKEVAERMRGGTLGYSVARQAPDGMIHLITTMNRPCLEFEFNEAWILSQTPTPNNDQVLMKSSAETIGEIQFYQENYPNGKIRLRYQGGIANDGRFLLHGEEEWFYPDGTTKYQAEFRLGRKVGKEKFYSAKGQVLWEKEYSGKGKFTWRQFWKNGKLKAESHWVNMKCEGIARRWNRAGKLVSEVQFAAGGLVE